MRDYTQDFKLVNNCLQYTGPKGLTLEQALAQSIAKWTKVAMFCAQEDTKIKEKGCHTCGLCLTFNCCEKCPIGRDTEDGCNTTPYTAYLDAADAISAIEAALAMRKYLVGLKEKLATEPTVTHILDIPSFAEIQKMQKVLGALDNYGF